jgi:hypothetical protein
MIMPFSPDEKPPSYKEYKNRSFTKHTDLVKNQMWRIKECSLKAEDKIKLLHELISIIQSKL